MIGTDELARVVGAGFVNHIMRYRVGSSQITHTSVLAKERKSGAPPLLGIQFSFDVVERI